MTARPMLESVVFAVPDISCGHCEATIREALAALDGVEQAVPSAATKQVAVVFDPARAPRDRIVEALAEAGYPAGE